MSSSIPDPGSGSATLLISIGPVPRLPDVGSRIVPGFGDGEAVELVEESLDPVGEELLTAPASALRQLRVCKNTVSSYTFKGTMSQERSVGQELLAGLPSTLRQIGDCKKYIFIKC